MTVSGPAGSRGAENVGERNAGASASNARGMERKEGGAAVGQAIGEKAQVYTHESQLPVYAMNWSVRKDKPFRLGVASFVEDYCNRVEVRRTARRALVVVAGCRRPCCDRPDRGPG